MSSVSSSSSCVDEQINWSRWDELDERMNEIVSGEMFDLF